MKKMFSLCVCVVALVLVSCDKEKVYNPQDSALRAGNKSVRTFESMDDLYREINLLNDMDFNEIVSYEDMNGYQSFGRLAYQAVETILQDSSNPDLMLRQLNNYQLYLQTITEGTTQYVDIRYDNTPFTFIMNKDRIFIVADSVYKVFDTCIVKCGISQKESLIFMDENDLREVEDTPEFHICSLNPPFAITQRKYSNYGDHIQQDAVNDKEKVKTDLYSIPVDSRMVNGRLCFTAYMYLKIKGFRKFAGTFWPVQRTLSDNIAGGMVVHTTEYWNSVSGGSEGFQRTENIIAKPLQMPEYITSPAIYISYAVGYGRIPAVAAVYNFQ